MMAKDKAQGIATMYVFRQLDREYRENTEDSPAVEALNMLPADERAIIIMHIANRGRVTDTAEILKCDRHTLRGYLLRLRVEIEDNMRTVNRRRERDEWLS